MNTLQNSISDTGTAYTVDTILMQQRTPAAATHTWIVAEDIDDVRVYEKHRTETKSAYFRQPIIRLVTKDANTWRTL